MALFNKYGIERSASPMIVQLTPAEVRRLELDGRSLKSNLAVYWPANQYGYGGPELLKVLKDRWEDASHLLR